MTRNAFLSIFGILIAWSTANAGLNGGLISRNVPAYASSGIASYANDNDYDTTWLGTVPGWIAYDLSNVPAAKRSQILVVYYNNSFDYDQSVHLVANQNNLGSYTIEGNPAPGGGTAPESGWVTLVSVTSNKKHSRQHVIKNFKGYNWLRVNISASDGTSGNMGASCNLDVYDASTGQALQENWIFYGDSITVSGMQTRPLHGSSTLLNFSQVINKAEPDSFPVAECGGISGVLSEDILPSFDSWLSIFPGRYCVLNFGTNDAGWGTEPAYYYNNMKTLIQKVIRAGKIPVIPLIPWGRGGSLEGNTPNLNAKIIQLYSEFPQIVHGPDFWTYFTNRPDLISVDNVHPTPDGYIAYRQQWIDIAFALSFMTNSAPATTTNSTQTIPYSGATFDQPFIYSMGSMIITNRIKVVFPPYFMSMDINFTGGTFTSISMPSNCIGEYQLMASLDYFRKPVLVSLHYDAKLAPPETNSQQIGLYFHNGFKWIPVHGDLDPKNHLFSFSTNKISSTYFLFLDDPNKTGTGIRPEKNLGTFQWYDSIFSPNGNGRKNSTHLEILLASPSKVTLQIFNRDHVLIRTLLNDQSLSGNNYSEWDGKNENGKIVPSGAYLYTLKVNNMVKNGYLFVEN